MLVNAINSREAESTRVSRVLHDEVGQVLSAVGLQLEVLKLDFKDRIPELVDRTREIQQTIDQAVRHVRALSYDLNPAVVERAGLQLSLDRLVGRVRDQHAGGIRYMFDSSVRVPPDVGTAWYKIAELALANAIQHSAATHLELQVKPGAKGYMLEVRDNGRGFSLDSVREEPPGLGLLLMEHHAASAHVTLEIKSAPEKGVSIRSVWKESAEARG